MNRRNFLSLFGAGVAGIAIEKAIPFGRVWSFPKEIVIPEVRFEEFAFDQLNLKMTDWQRDFARSFKVGQTLRVRIPQRWIVTHEPKVTWYTRADIDRIYSGAPPTLPPVIQLKSRRAFPEVGIPES